MSRRVTVAEHEAFRQNLQDESDFDEIDLAAAERRLDRRKESEASRVLAILDELGGGEDD